MLVRVEREGKIGELVLNRPEKLNALNEPLLEEFSAGLTELGRDDSISCIIIRGEGRAFSVGYDIAMGREGVEFEENAYLDWVDLRKRVERWIQVLDTPKPVMTAIHGHCMGGATMLSVCADLTVVANEATMGWPSLPLGSGLLGPVSMWLIGPKRAKELSFVAGSSFSGVEAAQNGWANRAVPEERMLEVARELATDVARTPLSLLRLKKLAFNRVLDIQGFRESVLFGVEWDTISHTAAEATGNANLIEQLGLKGAIAQFRAS